MRRKCAGVFLHLCCSNKTTEIMFAISLSIITPCCKFELSSQRFSSLKYGTASGYRDARSCLVTGGCSWCPAPGRCAPLAPLAAPAHHASVRWSRSSHILRHHHLSSRLDSARPLWPPVTAPAPAPVTGTTPRVGRIPLRDAAAGPRSPSSMPCRPPTSSPHVVRLLFDVMTVVPVPYRPLTSSYNAGPSGGPGSGSRTRRAAAVGTG